jgi:RNA polymerase sigma-70 factor (ECF subfamily)
LYEDALGDELGRLMASAQSGDADAYTELLRRLVPQLRRIVRRHRRVFADPQVEDIVQDVLLSIHAVRATYDPSRPFMPWLLAVTRNRLADAARRYARGAAHEVVVDDLDVTFPGHAAKVSEGGDVEALRQAVAELPRVQREAIEMLKFREMSLKEAASARGTTVGALKVATHRAMSALRKRLTKP